MKMGPLCSMHHQHQRLLHLAHYSTPHAARENCACVLQDQSSESSLQEVFNAVGKKQKLGVKQRKKLHAQTMNSGASAVPGRSPTSSAVTPTAKVLQPVQQSVPDEADAEPLVARTTLAVPTAEVGRHNCSVLGVVNTYAQPR